MKSRRNVRSTRKSRKVKRGGGIFTEKTLADNKRNCMAYWDNNRSERDRLCNNNKHLNERMYPGWRKRMMGQTTGSDIGSNFSF